MNSEPPDDKESEIPGYREELAAEIAVKKVLTRIRLEDAAKGQGYSGWSWVARIAVVIALIRSDWRYEYQSFIISVIVLYLLFGGGQSRANSRIDAILKLAELDKKEASAAAAELGK